MLGIGTNDKFTLSRYFRFQLVYGIDLNLMLCDQVGKEFSWRLGTHITGQTLRVTVFQGLFGCGGLLRVDSIPGLPSGCTGRSHCIIKYQIKCHQFKLEIPSMSWRILFLMQEQLFLMYHDPCLDGVYSMLGMVLPILTKVRRDGWTIPQYTRHLEKVLLAIKTDSDDWYQKKRQHGPTVDQPEQQDIPELSPEEITKESPQNQLNDKLLEKQQNANGSLKETANSESKELQNFQFEGQQAVDVSQKDSPQNLDQSALENYVDQALDDKAFFYTRIPDLIYLPMKLTENADEVQPVLKYLKASHNSILILVDYFGRTWPNMLLLTKHFKFVIFVDHHMTCVNEVRKHPKYDFQKFTKLNYLDHNMFLLVDTEKAACQLVQDFHEYVEGRPYEALVPRNLGLKLRLFTKYVADNDLFILQYRETEPLQMAIMKERFNYDARNNQLILHELLSMDFELMIKKGQHLAEERKKKVAEVIKRRKTFCFSKEARGYAILCDDLSILNPLGAALAILSLKSGDHNLAAVYHDDKNNPRQYKIHLRSAHHDENWKLLERYRCDKLAESFGGGGHVGAASMYMTKQQWRKYIYE